MITIACNDFLARFRTPFGWILLAISQLVLGGFYFLLLNNYFQKLRYSMPTKGITYEIISLLVAMLIYLALFLVPVLAMRSLAYERRNHSLELILSAPVSSWSIVLGKFTGMMLFLLFPLFAIILMSLPLAWTSSLDWGVTGSTLLGGLLLLTCYSAIAFYFSCLIKQPLIAGLSASLALLTTLLFDFMANTRIVWLDQTLNHLSLIRHFENLINGVISSGDISYFIIVSLLFLYLSKLQLDYERFYARNS